MSFNTGMKTGTFLTLERLIEADIRSGVVRLTSGATYAIESSNNSGVALNNGFFANPIETPQTTANANEITALQAAIAQLEEDMAKSFKMVSATPSRTIAAGSSGTIETITPTADQKVRITLLVSTGTTTEGDISILSGADTIVDSVVINGNDTPQSIDLNNRLSVGGQGPNHNYIEGGLGEVVTIVKDTGSTSNNLFIAHEIWEQE